MRVLIDRAIQINADYIINRIRQLVCAPEIGELSSAKLFEEQLRKLRKELEGQDD